MIGEETGILYGKEYEPCHYCEVAHKKLKELEEENSKLLAENLKHCADYLEITSKIKELEEALKLYADRKNWHHAIIPFERDYENDAQYFKCKYKQYTVTGHELAQQALKDKGE